MIRRVKDYTYEEATDLLKYIDPESKVIIDLGAGKRDSPISSQIATIKCDHLISVEAFEPYLVYLEGAHSAKLHDIVNLDLLDYKLPSSDVVILIDVVEHLTKVDALAILLVAQRSSKKVIIFTPQGDTIGYSNHDMNNELQTHKSAWDAEELELLGFDVTVYENFHTHVKDIPVGAMWAVWDRKDADGR